MTEIITLGNAPDGVGGDSVKTAFDKVNSNFNVVDTSLDNKVDKELGKGLSESDYTTEEKSKLAGIAAEATKNRADSENADKVHDHTASQVTGLGSAATADLTTSNTDVTAGRVLKVNDFGVGEAGLMLSDFSDVSIPNGFYRWNISVTANLPIPATYSHGTIIVTGNATGGTQNHRSRILIALNHDKVWFQRSVNMGPWTDPVEMYHTGNLLNIGTTAATARTALGLGTAATANATLGANDSVEGKVMSVGSGGWMSLTGSGPLAEGMDTSSLPTSLRLAVASTPGALGPGVFLHLQRVDGDAYQLHFYGNNVASRKVLGSTYPTFSVFYTSTNTTIDPDGTLKASSPVINLYTDKHDLHNEEQFGASPTVTRKSKGVYEITGTLGLRSEGWYLDTPSDRNGNKYFNVEWTQNITPEVADGVVDEYRDDIVVTIETFERVWNKDTGMFDNGDPMDINELQDRFVQLRFNELKVEEEEVMNENK